MEICQHTAVLPPLACLLSMVCATIVCLSVCVCLRTVLCSVPLFERCCSVYSTLSISVRTESSMPGVPLQRSRVLPKPLLTFAAARLCSGKGQLCLCICSRVRLLFDWELTAGFKWHHKYLIEKHLFAGICASHSRDKHNWNTRSIMSLWKHTGEKLEKATSDGSVMKYTIIYRNIRINLRLKHRV